MLNSDILNNKSVKQFLAVKEQEARTAIEEARATRIEWNIAGSEAVLDYHVREPYTFNLKEEKFEPS